MKSLASTLFLTLVLGRESVSRLIPLRHTRSLAASTARQHSYKRTTRPRRLRKPIRHGSVAPGRTESLMRTPSTTITN